MLVQLASAAGSVGPFLLAATSKDGLLPVWDSAALAADQKKYRDAGRVHVNVHRPQAMSRQGLTGSYIWPSTHLTAAGPVLHTAACPQPHSVCKPTQQGGVLLVDHNALRQLCQASAERLDVDVTASKLYVSVQGHACQPVEVSASQRCTAVAFLSAVACLAAYEVRC